MNDQVNLRSSLHATTQQLNQILSRYSTLASTASTSYSASGVVSTTLLNQKLALEQEYDTSLQLFSSQIDRLNTYQATVKPPPSTSQVHALERHREVLTEYTRDYQRTKASLREAEQRASLLGSVRDEISAFKSSAHSSATDALLSERDRIDNSHSMTDQVLGQAYETRAEFNRQRTGLQGINAKMNGVIAQVPALNSILGMINSRRRRDSFIVGGVICGCVLILCYVFIL